MLRVHAKEEPRQHWDAHTQPLGCNHFNGLHALSRPHAITVSTDKNYEKHKICNKCKFAAQGTERIIVSNGEGMIRGFENRRVRDTKCITVNYQLSVNTIWVILLQTYASSMDWGSFTSLRLVDSFSRYSKLRPRFEYNTDHYQKIIQTD